MGLYPVPYYANLFLYNYENKQINETKKADIGRARQFRNSFRFLNDLTALNDYGEFERSFLEINSRDQELKKNFGRLEESFLDLMITIKDKKLCTKLFDKREGFHFQLYACLIQTVIFHLKFFDSPFGEEIIRNNKKDKMILPSLKKF